MFDWLTDNRVALFLLAVLTGFLIAHEVPGPNGQLVGAGIGGIIGFLTGATRRQGNGGPPSP